MDDTTSTFMPYSAMIGLVISLSSLGIILICCIPFFLFHYHALNHGRLGLYSETTNNFGSRSRWIASNDSLIPAMMLNNANDNQRNQVEEGNEIQDGIEMV